MRSLCILQNNKEIEVTSSPYFLERTCNKILCKYCGGMQKLIETQEQIEAMQIKLDIELKKVNSLLFDEIGKLKEEYIKNAVKLKRTLSSKKLSKIDLNSINYLSNKCKERIENCKNMDAKIIALKNTKDSILKNNKEQLLDFLKNELHNNKPFSNALMISINDELYKNILSFENASALKLNKKTRDTIYSLHNYCNRMLKKPSPFSTFVSTSIFLYSDKFEKNSEEFSYTPKVYVNELVTKTLENLLLEDNRFVNYFYIKINSTILLHKDHYEFLNVKVSNSKMYYVENILKAKRNSKADIIIEELSNLNNIKLLDFAEILFKKYNSIFSSINEIVILILKLDKIGVIYKNFNIDHQDFNMLNKLGDLCSKIDDKKYLKIKNSIDLIIENIDKINANFSISVVQKYKIRSQIFSEVKSIFSMYPANVCDLNFIRKNILYENNTYPSIKYKDFGSEEEFRNFYYIEKLYRLFDNNYISRILCRNMFLRNHNVDSEVPVFEFYKEISSSKKQLANQLIESDRDIKIIADIRKEFLDYLNRHMNINGIDIPIDFIEKLYAKAPKIMKDKISYGMYYQTDGRKIVVNHIAPGMGRHIVRYISDLNKKDREKFKKVYRTHLQDMEKGDLVFTDIGSTLGLGINKHITVLNASFSYPKSVYKNEVKFSDLHVFFDTNADAVKIADNNHVVYESTPMGFLFPRVSPDFYSFLSTLSNTQGGGTSFWDRYYNQYERQNKFIEYFPEITIGKKFVLDRKTWKIDPKSIEADPSKSEADNYIDFYNYLCKENQIPSRFFAKMSNDIDGILELGKSLDDWEKVISNNKLRKPQFYDLDNYLDYHNLRSLIKNNKDTILTVQEYLPESESTTEYLLELNERRLEK